jgi:hypothetical protein
LCQQPKNTFYSMFYWTKSCKKLFFTKNFLTQRGNKSRKSCLICHRAVYWSPGLGFPRSSQDSGSLPSRNFRDKKRRENGAASSGNGTVCHAARQCKISLISIPSSPFFCVSPLPHIGIGRIPTLLFYSVLYCTCIPDHFFC